jgi:hypothetical protein
VLTLALVGVVAGGGCGQDQDACPAAQGYALPRPFEEHACMHVAVGPFETVSAQGSGDLPPPELRNTHVAYTVELPLQGEAPAGRVMFKPRDTAPFAFFLDSEAPLAFRRAGAGVCPAASHTVAACTGLRRVVYFDLERKVEYELSWNESAPARVMVVVEPVTAVVAP